MDRVITFGQFKGRTFAWLFFNAPWYADWLHRKEVLESRDEYDEEDRSCFRELHRRASALSEVCRYCTERRVVRRALSLHSGGLGMSAFCCGDCMPINEGMVLCEKPSYFMPPDRWTRVEQKRLTQTIKQHYIGKGSLRQRKMESFFGNDELFRNPTSNYFKRGEVDS